MSDPRPRVLIAADVDPWLVRQLLADARFATSIKPAYTADELRMHIGSAEALVTRFHNELSRQVIEAAPDLRLIVQGTSGLDNIDHAAAAERDVAIVGIPGGNANAVAELVLGNVIALTRTVPAYDRMVRAGAWQRADCASRRELRGHRAGIVGLGRVGGRLARLLGSLDVTVAAYDPYITDADFRDRGATRAVSLEALLATSDILSLHVPLTAETRGMIDAQKLALLPRGAIVVNSCRGAVLQREAALAALANGTIAGLALDVYEEEPPGAIAWPDDPRLILTPHIAGCTAEAKLAIAMESYTQLCAFFDLSPLAPAQ